MKSVGHRDNLGIPAGRNSGVASVDGDFLVFVDDDACLPEPDVLSRLAALFAADPSLGLVQPRFADPDGRPTPRQWVPRLRKGRPGAQQRRRRRLRGRRGAAAAPVYDEVGGWPETFWYAHEGIDLAWRVWDSGHRVRYVGDIVVHHPVVVPQRHADFYRYTSRNRVLLARRHLPLPVGAAYLTTWILLTVLAREERRRAGRVAARLPRGLPRPGRPAPADPVAHDLAHDAGRPPAGDLRPMTTQPEQTRRRRDLRSAGDRGSSATSTKLPARTGAAELAARYGLASDLGPAGPARSTCRQVWARRHFLVAFSNARMVSLYSRTRLGQLWQLLTPLLNAGVYLLLFGVLLDTIAGRRQLRRVPGHRRLHLQLHPALGAAAARTRSSGNLGLIRALHFPRATPAAGVHADRAAAALRRAGRADRASCCSPASRSPGAGCWSRSPWRCRASSTPAWRSSPPGSWRRRRDVNQVLPFFLRTWLYMSGVFYSIPVHADRFPARGCRCVLRGQPGAPSTSTWSARRCSPSTSRCRTRGRSPSAGPSWRSSSASSSSGARRPLWPRLTTTPVRNRRGRAHRRRRGPARRLPRARPRPRRATRVDALKRMVRGQRRPGMREIHAVRGVSLVADGGDAIGVIGRNGSGKSTLLRGDRRPAAPGPRARLHRRPALAAGRQRRARRATSPARATSSWAAWRWA